MSLTTYSPSRNRVYLRRFDHEEAQARYQAGETVQALADEYGVTTRAVYRVVIPGEKQRDLEASRRWRTGTCERCGGPAVRLVTGKKEHNPDGRTLCRTCRRVLMRKKLRYSPDGQLLNRCARCSEWKPLDQFGPRLRRLIAEAKPIGKSYCRACEAAARQAYRERHKVPCDRCGQPCLPPNEKGANSRRDRNLCRPCYRETEWPEQRRRAWQALQQQRAKKAT